MLKKISLTLVLFAVTSILWSSMAFSESVPEQNQVFEPETLTAAEQDVRNAIKAPMPPYQRAQLAEKWARCPIHIQAVDAVIGEFQEGEAGDDERRSRLMQIIDNFPIEQKGPRWVALAEHCFPERCSNAAELERLLTPFPQAYAHVMEGWLKDKNAERGSKNYLNRLKTFQAYGEENNELWPAVRLWLGVIMNEPESVWRDAFGGSEAFRTKMATLIFQKLYYLNDQERPEGDVRLRLLKLLANLPVIDESLAENSGDKEMIRNYREKLTDEVRTLLEDKIISRRIVAMLLVSGQQLLSFVPDIEKVYMDAKNATERAQALECLWHLRTPNVKNAVKLALGQKEPTLRLEAANIIQEWNELIDEDIEWFKTVYVGEIWPEISALILQKMLSQPFADKENFLRGVILSNKYSQEVRRNSVELAYLGNDQLAPSLIGTMADIKAAETSGLAREARYLIAESMMRNATDDDSLVAVYSWVTEQDDDSYPYARMLGTAFRNGKKLRPVDYKAFLLNVCQTESNQIIPACLNELATFKNESDASALYDQLRNASYNDAQNAATEMIFDQ